ncbi:MAG: efflux RND transporter periplasmic adaptor subunit [Burkholderiaceae bacterium]|jgi:cobalt-zinc-cadmium efflux system membrane fusion protein
MKSTYTSVLTFALVSIGVISLTACEKTPKPLPKPAAVAAADPFAVKLNPQMAGRIKVGLPQEAEVGSRLTVSGRVDVDEQKLVRIGSSMTGRVVEVLVNTGDAIKTGQALARISSPELTNAQLAYLRAASAATLAQKAVERADQLIAADVIGAAEQQRRQAEVQVARAELNAARDQLRLLGMSNGTIEHLRKAGDIQSAVPITAPRAGVVIDRRVNVGQVVQPADPLFAVADLSSVWIVGGVPEQAAKAVAVNQTAEVDVPALHKTFTGRIVFVSDTIQPESRTVTVRTEVRNADRELKPAMLATLRINGMPSKMLTVPAEAVVRENDKDHVFVQTGPGAFRLVPVELGADTLDGRRPIVTGLTAQQTIAVDGAFHLNNERKRTELE